MSFYVSYGAGVQSLNSLQGALTLVAGSNITITPSGSDLTIAATGGGGGGANTSLSNLASTAINADLIFEAGRTGFIKTKDGGATPAIEVASGDGTTSGALVLISGTATSGDSGDLIIRSGPAAGQSGKVILKNGTQSNPDLAGGVQIDGNASSQIHLSYDAGVEVTTITANRLVIDQNIIIQTPDGHSADFNFRTGSEAGSGSKSGNIVLQTGLTEQAGEYIQLGSYTNPAALKLTGQSTGNILMDANGITLNSTSSSAGDVEIDAATMNLFGDAATVQLEMIFWDIAENNTVSLMAPDVGVDSYKLKLPAAIPSPGDVLTVGTVVGDVVTLIWA